MARRLSNAEWATFLHEVDIKKMALPPWGGIVEWNGLQVLVYIGPTGEAFLTDVTGSQFAANFQRTWDANSQVFWYHLPRETMAVIAEQSKTALTGTSAILGYTGATIGGAIGALTGPLLKNLWLPIVIALVILGFIYLPRVK